MNELSALVSFSVFPGIGPARFRLLYSYFGTAGAAWKATKGELQSTGLSQKIIDRFLEFRSTFSVDQYFTDLEQKRIRVVSFLDTTYPERLKQIPDPPLVLYVYGEDSLSLLSELRLIGIVGTRMITQYGRDVTRKLTRDLVRSGFGIVSGLAFGVDAEAHNTTLQNGGKTIAVLGCGVDVIAPISNAPIYREIARKGGLIVSEMPIGHRPDRGLFPARNRIISGLSLGIVVTEGSEDSGALITASYAAEQGRDVFAVPGPITSIYSRGPAKLLKAGATLAESAQDILDQLQISKGASPDIQKSLTDEEQWVVRAIQKGGVHVDDLLRTGAVTRDRLFILLTQLELKNIIIKNEKDEYNLI